MHEAPRRRKHSSATIAAIRLARGRRRRYHVAMAESAPQPPARTRPQRRTGPVFTALKIGWWILAVIIVGPILIGVIRGSF
jgi:hypothetical protein